MEYRLGIRMTIFLIYLILNNGVTEQTSMKQGENNGLNFIHQPFAKTVQIEDGDIFDCVDINLQPAFEHPLLKNHTLQMKPSSYPAGLGTKSPSKATTSQAKMSAIACPSGMVPIWRNDNEYLTTILGVDTMIKNAKLGIAGLGRVKDIYGTRATINVYEPKVREKDGDNSASLTMILSGHDGDHLDSIGAGSFVWPSFLGDNFARFHIFWWDNILGKECHDHLCKGFVQVSQSIGLGGRIQQVSVYNGPQYAIDVLLFKDPKTRNWWAAFGPNNTLIGYWPNSLFTSLSEKGDGCFWGGIVNGPTVDSNPPQMGSGHFASEGFGKAAFIKNIQIVTEDNKLVNPKSKDCRTDSGRPKCYTAGGAGVDDGGMYVYFGGPGGCQD